MSKKQASEKEPQNKSKKQPTPKAAKGKVVEKESKATDAVEKKDAKKHKEETTQIVKDMIPVIYDGKKDEYHAANFSHLEIVNPTDDKVDPKYDKYVALVKKEGRMETVIYVAPSTFEEYVLSQKYTPANSQKIREKVLESLYEFKHAWVQLGIYILAVSRSRLYLTWGFKTFNEYCDKELKLHQSTVHEIMDSTIFLCQKDPELFQRLMTGKSQSVIEELPAYHSIYLLSKKQKNLGEEKFTELFTQVMNGQISSSELQKKLREIFGSKESAPTLDSLATNYKKWHENLIKAKPSEEILKKAGELLNLLQTSN